MVPDDAICCIVEEVSHRVWERNDRFKRGVGMQVKTETIFWIGSNWYRFASILFH